MFLSAGGAFPWGRSEPAGSRKEVIRLSSTGKEEQQPLFSGVRLKEMAGKLRGFSKTAFRFGYRCCYVTGVRTVRVFRYTGRRLGRVLAPAGRFFYKAADKAVLRHLRALGAEARRFGQGFPEAGRRLKAAWQRNPLLCIPQALLLPALAFRRHRKAAVSLVNLAMPAAAAVFLVFTIQFWTGQTFGLALECGGRQLGYIADEAVYDQAANMASERVINTDNSFQVERTPKLTLAMVSQDEMLDATALCDEILRASSDSIAEASGLYIDGKFEGSVESRAELDGVLDGILKAYCDGSANERAEFIQKVEVVDGLYPISSIVTAADMQSYLTSESVVAKHYTVQAGETLGAVARKNDMTLTELRAMNPAYQDTDMVHIGDEILVQRPQAYLRVQVIRTITYTEEIPFEVEKIEDSKQYTSYSKVKTQGVKGSKDVTAEITLVDGIEQSRTIVEEKVTKEPVTKVMVVGTKKQLSSAGTTVVAGDGITTGQFVWPVPICHNTSRGFAGGHGALDICNGPVTVRNQPFIAADGGVVVEASNGYNGGYGKMIRIRHSNGYETLYAHCNALYVVKGQTVSKGQKLGLIGSTGNSTGPHLHFEVIKNGRRIDPMQFFR